jgi:hypothetical protein
VPATSTSLNRLLFLLQPLTVLMKHKRQAVRAVKQSILLRCLCAKRLLDVWQNGERKFNKNGRSKRFRERSWKTFFSFS